MVDLNLLRVDTYVPSNLHRNERIFPESNCYTDLWIELLHSRGLEPEAALCCGLAVDFEGDQWTFIKPNPSDLLLLFGIDVHEMQLYRPLVDHLSDQLARDRTMIVEVDSFYLPDTVGLTYRQAHQKSSIAIAGLHKESSRLVYFHGRALHEAHGEDFRNLLQVNADAATMPPYAELVRFDAARPCDHDALRAGAMAILSTTLDRRPAENPWLTFGVWLDRRLPELISGDFEQFQAIAFATVRQAGAAFQAAQDFTDWLLPGHPAVAGLGQQVEGAKTLLLKLARMRPFAVAEFVEPLAGAYDEALRMLLRVA